jgi:hypothetical protein
MAKSRKKKSGKKQGTGQTLGALALILSIVALGLGLYQFILPTAVGPQIYIVSNDDLFHLDGISLFEYLDPLNITYTTKVGDSVVLEFSCRIYLYPATFTTIAAYFDNNGTFPSSSIYVSSDSYFETSGYMRHTFEATTAGENYLVIYSYIDDEGTNTYIRNSLLTVTVYG